MASRSMHYLRKNAKPIMVVMGVVCMITFGIGAAITDILSSRSSSGEHKDPIALTWTKGAVREGQLSTMRMRHVAVVEFLSRLIGETLQRGGRPVINGQAISDQFMLQRSGIGIPTDDSDQGLVETMLLAEEARRMGIVVDRDAVKAHLKQLSSPELSEREWGEQMDQTLENKPLTADEVLDHLAYELQAQHARTLTVGRLDSVPPGQIWECFNRLNRRMAIEAYPVDVQPFVADVKGEPTPAEIQKLFEEGRFRDPNPNSHEPGFRKPHKVAFEYVRIDFQPFLEAAQKQITDEEIKKRYEENIAQGKHKVQELPPATPPGETPKSPETPPVEKKEGDAKEGEKKEGDKPAETKPAEAKPADKPGEAVPAATPPASEKPAEKAEKKSEEKPAEPPPGDCQEKTGGAKAEQDKPAEKAAAPVEKSADQPAATKPAEAKPGETPPETKPAETKPGETPPAEAKPGEAKPGEAKPEPPKEQKFKPLEEVKEEIRKELAQAPAQDARNKAVKEVTDAINAYGNRYRPWIAKKEATQGKIDLSKSDPGKFDLAKVAQKHGFKTDSIPLSDRFEAAKTDIGQHVSMLDFQAIQANQIRYLKFADIAFGVDQPLFTAQEANSEETDVTYVYYRTAEEKGSEVKLADVKDQIVSFWKRQKAFELAKADAQKIAAKVKENAGKPLSELVTDPAKVVAPAPFSWMTTGSLGFGFGMPSLSEVKGIDLSGRDFMQAVFALQPGEVGIAPNEAHNKVYVVRLTGQEPSESLLRTQFMESGMSNPVMMVAQSDLMRTVYEWYRGIEERYQVKWQRPPFDSRRG